MVPKDSIYQTPTGKAKNNQISRQRISSENTETTSRFQRSGRHPLALFNEIKKQQFFEMYDHIQEQGFAHLETQIMEEEEEKQLEQDNYYYEQVSIQEGQQAASYRNRIFDEINFDIIGKTCIQIEKQSVRSEYIQTSFISGSQQNRDQYILDNNSIQSLYDKNEELLQYLENNYEYSRWQIHDNWKPNLSETRFRLPEEDYDYSYCDKCNNILKKYQLEIHQKSFCGENPTRQYKEMIRKFSYQLRMEVSHLRDYDIKCQQTRMYCYIALEIMRLLIKNDTQNQNANKLKEDLIKINNYVQLLSHTYNHQICSLFDNFIIRI